MNSEDHDRTRPYELWMMTADRRSARLLSATRVSHGRLHVVSHASVEEVWDELQHGRPSPRTSKDGHTYASEGHEREERIQRFARSVATWLEEEMKKRGIEKLHAFAAPRFLGHLRSVLPDRLHEHVRDVPLNLAHLSPGELASHDAIMSICPAAVNDDVSTTTDADS